MQIDTSRPDLKDRYEKDGFVLLNRFMEGTHLAQLQCEIQHFIKDQIPKLPSEHVFYESKDDVESLKQIQHLEVHSDYFRDLITEGPIPNLAKHLLNSEAIPKNLQYFNKPPQRSRATPPHQDGYYFMLRPCEAVTFWLALDEANDENGCVRYVRASHRQGLRNHQRTTTLGFSQGIADYPTSQDLEDEIAIHAQPGDLLAHHALTIHRADENSSPSRSRQALGFIYYSINAAEDQQAHEAYQKTLATELREQGRI